MNWSGGGLQRHAKGNNSITKLQKAHFAKVRNSRQALAVARPISDQDERPAKVQKTSESISLTAVKMLDSDKQPITSTSDALEATKQQLLAASDWVGLDQGSVPSLRLGHHRHRIKGDPLIRRSAGPLHPLRNTTVPFDEHVSVRVGVDALATSPTKADSEIMIGNEHAGRRRSGSSCMAKRHRVRQQSERGNLVATQSMPCAASSDDILFDDMSQHFSDILGPYETNDVEKRVALASCSATTNMPVTELHDQPSRSVAHDPFESQSAHTVQQQHSPIPSPDSVWMRFIFGSTPPPHSSPNKQSDISKLSLAARASSSTSSATSRGRPNMDTLSMAVQFGHGRAREVSCAAWPEDSEGV